MLQRESGSQELFVAVGHCCNFFLSSTWNTCNTFCKGVKGKFLHPVTSRSNQSPPVCKDVLHDIVSIWIRFIFFVFQHDFFQNNPAVILICTV
jgi:hypothetical protein